MMWKWVIDKSPRHRISVSRQKYLLLTMAKIKLVTHMPEDLCLTRRLWWVCFPYLPRILLTQPWLTRSCREMSQGLTPWCASSTILCLTTSGRGLPFTNTPPSWFTPPCPIWDTTTHTGQHNITYIQKICSFRKWTAFAITQACSDHNSVFCKILFEQAKHTNTRLHTHTHESKTYLFSGHMAREQTVSFGPQI